jgi:hypothetical protein
MAEAQEQVDAVRVPKEIIDSFYGIASKAFEGTEKVRRLSMDMAKETLDDWYESVLRPSGEAERTLASQLPLAQRSSQRALTYGRQLLEISWTTQVQLVQAVVMVEYQEVNRQFQWFASNVASSAPIGSESANEFLKRIATLSNQSLKMIQDASVQTFEQARQAPHRTFDHEEGVKNAKEVTRARKSDAALDDRSRKHH